MICSYSQGATGWPSTWWGTQMQPIRASVYILQKIVHHNHLERKGPIYISETPCASYINHNFQRKGNGFDILSQ